MEKYRMQTYLTDVEMEAIKKIKELNPCTEVMKDTELLRYIILDYCKLLELRGQTEQGKEISMILNIVSRIGDHWQVQMGDSEDSMTFRYAQDYVQRKLDQRGKVRYESSTKEQKEEILETNSEKKIEKIDPTTEEGYRQWKALQQAKEEAKRKEEEKKSTFVDDDDWLKDF
ncbi:hypothetical protein [Catellicoccus marimammalium]|uniref:Uncharacterized protein n=1 Tax=Catellicoccus marimammalium M35/04/3 TaxID=1234409 RepID=K8Z852_9ENTE|nr:hypothetical protein [Catellicoccus marimammalium]EKU27199.1 hypothetical protein C683_0856 [Catellicoccus marimammalium M35/04/3]